MSDFIVVTCVTHSIFQKGLFTAPWASRYALDTDPHFAAFDRLPDGSLIL